MKFSRVSLPVINYRSLALLALFNCLLIILIFVFFLPFLANPIGLSVVLPRALTSEVLSGKDIVVAILSDNSVYLDTQRVSLEGLKRIIRTNKGMAYQVLIKADHRANVGTLAKVWDLFRQANVSKINIATNE